MQSQKQGAWLLLMDNQGDVLQAQRVDEALHEAGVVVVMVADVRLVRLAHADEVHGDCTPDLGDVRDDVAARWVAVQRQNGFALALLHVEPCTFTNLLSKGKAEEMGILRRAGG
eukprot:CAMPEP_0179958686 /NCGR_PEP_ID=MMETSP0983-20121128/28163_1 /TAXON_ID=483367 /ORGANISM="non described non described, Strain CCMP 2436" /LENGTH=113 /DNA_ID=CAMNT_0021870833 /DNA_START=980 /DNA_END=1317 /DNA_ORIENTATION=+